MTDLSTRPIPRWRLITFWVLMVVLLVLHLGDRPQQLIFIVTTFGELDEGATHEIHWFATGVFAWVMVASVLANLRRPAEQVGAAWTYALGTVLAFSLIAVFADLPAEVVPILIAGIAVAVLAFVAHPSSLRARVTPIARPSVPLYALVGAAALPLLPYAVGQLNIHLGSGAGDEHFTFGHWLVMTVYAVLVLLFGAIAATKVSGWRFPLWASGVMLAALGVASLGITAVSQLDTVWALLAIVWGVAFIAVGEREARIDQPAQPVRSSATDTSG